MNATEAIGTLRQINSALRSALLRLRPERKLCSAITPQDFSDLVRQLKRARECLRLFPSHATVAPAIEKEAIEKETMVREKIEEEAFEKEIFEYRENLQQLKRSLPDVQLRLLAERSRLQTARTHAAAAAEWERSRKQTL